MLLHLSQTKFDSTFLYPIICVIIEADLTLPVNMASSAPRVAYEHGRGFGSLWKEGSSKRSISLFKVFFFYIFHFFPVRRVRLMMHRAPLPFPSEMCNDRFTVLRQPVLFCVFLILSAATHDLGNMGEARAWIHPSPYAAATWTSAKLTGRARASNTTS